MRDEHLKKMPKEIEKLIDAENWPAARKLIRVELRNEPDSHWLLTRLGLTYYEQRNYRKALFYVTQAMKLAPDCPLVLWDYAGTLNMLGQNKEAIAIYKKLVKRGAEKIAHGKCGEGLASARSLIADCLYRIAKCYEDQSHYKKALDFYDRYIEHRKLGSRSIYRISEVKNRITKLRSFAIAA